VYDYDAAKGPVVYKNGTWKKPVGPPLKLTMVEADSVPPYFQLNGPLPFQAGTLRTNIDPRSLDHGVLQRADLFVLRMIQDGWPARPIYFARTSGGYARSLGLGDYTVTQGLAAKVFMPPEASAARDTVYIQGDGWLDLTRTDSLWKVVFKGPQSVIKTGDWIDRPSVGIPYLYVATGMELAEALRMRGRFPEAQHVFQTTKSIAQAVRLGDVLQGAEKEFGAAAAADTARAMPLLVPPAATKSEPAATKGKKTP
jgi:hypothetical protein